MAPWLLAADCRQRLNIRDGAAQICSILFFDENKISGHVRSSRSKGMMG